MKDSYIKTNRSGKETLIVFYDNEKADYDEMTELALQRHGLPKNSKINVICKPYHQCQQKRLFSHESS